MRWLRETLTSAATGTLSTKRSVVMAAAGCLLVVLLWVGAACAWWIYRSGDLGSGAVAALTLVGGIAAGLAGHAYRKPENVGVEAPSAGGATTRPNQPTPDGGTRLGTAESVGSTLGADSSKTSNGEP